MSRTVEDILGDIEDLKYELLGLERQAEEHESSETNKECEIRDCAVCKMLKE